MAFSLNSVKLIGRVGKIDMIPFGDKKFVKLSIATSNSWKDKQTQEWKEKTQWHCAFFSMTSVVEHIERSLIVGDVVYVEGEIEYSQYENKEGIKVNRCEIHCVNYKKVINARDKDRSSIGAGSAPRKEKKVTNEAPFTDDDSGADDDLPF